MKPTASDIEAERIARRLAGALRRVRATAVAARTTGLHVPTLDVDPPADDPTSMWRFEDGRIRVRRRDGGVDELHPYGYAGSIGTPTSDTPIGTDPQTVLQATTYQSTWALTFCPTHGIDNGLGYGYAAGHGRRRIMIGLPDTQIRADLAGSVVRDVQFSLRNTNANYNEVTIHFGGHDQADPPATYSSVREQVSNGQWSKSGSARFLPVHVWFGQRLRDDLIRGITINQPDDSTQWAGALADDSFQIRVTYTKEV